MIGHVEMLTTMLARLLEGARSETTEKAVAANPVLAAVIGGMSPQHAIVSGGNALPRDSEGTPWNTGYIVVDHGIENSNGEDEKQDQNHTFYRFDDASTSGEGRWAQGPTLIGTEDIIYAEGQPLTDDKPLGPAPSPKLFVLRAP
jgi:Mn-containing catalase